MCGIVGMISPAFATSLSMLNQTLLSGLKSLQHRGQDGFGLVSASAQVGVQTLKQVGMVSSCLKDHLPSPSISPSLSSLDPSAASAVPVVVGIAHNRYATFGGKNPQALGPFWQKEFPFLALAHNGNLVGELAESFVTDSEYMTWLLHTHLQEVLGPHGQNFTLADWPKGLSTAVKRLMGGGGIQGSYSCTGFLASHLLFAFRDPHGLRPLVLGQKDQSFLFASETHALEELGFTFHSEVRPGELVMIDGYGRLYREQIVPSEFRPCFFEWVYFAHARSTLAERGVEETRKRLGHALAMQVKEMWPGNTAGIDFVCGVPDTGMVAAQILAQELGIPYTSILTKNPTVNRSFILAGDNERNEILDRKFFVDAEKVKGKRFLLVDDSIVRGNTMKKLTAQIQNSCAGDCEMTVVSTCPPIRHPCFLGIDFPDERELISAHLEAQELAARWNVKAVVFLSLDGLLESLQMTAQTPATNRPCLGCLNGDYACSLTRPLTKGKTDE